MKPIKSIKILVPLITGLSLLSATIGKIFPSMIALPNLTKILSLGVYGVSKLHLWQFISHLFLYPATGGIHIFYLFNLFISMFLLQRMGTIVSFHKGEKAFLKLFFTCGITSGISAYYTLLSFGSSFLYAGPTSAIYGLVVASVFLFPRLDYMIGFSAPIQGRVLIPAFLGLVLIMNLSAGDYVHFFATLTSVITAYLYILFFWKIESPFRMMKSFDRWVIRLSKGQFGAIFESTNVSKYASTSRIYDIKTGRAILSEESYINALLEKISKEGRRSLTLYEKYRLYRYSKKQAKRIKST